MIMPTANKLRIWRAYADISQAELGAMLGVSKQMVCQWERGRRSITKERLAEIRKKLYIPARLV
jgi:transcriptional regulator with XRE-family HTH domain